jgi:hypothetical protein
MVTITAARRTRSSDGRPAAGRVFVALAAVLVGMVVAFMTFLAAPASAAPLSHPGNGVGVIAHPGGQRVGTHENIPAGQHRQRAPGYDSFVVGSGVGAETGASAASRVEQLQGVLDPIAQNSRTSAVLNTQEGIDVLASGGRDLSPAQRALANEGDLLARMPGAHAEVTALEGAFKAGLSPSEMAVSRLICPECQAFIENSGGTISPGGTGATWP